MTVLITGVAGFIGMHVAEVLLARGETILGIDNLNDYYDVNLKKARVARLEELRGFTFVHADIAEVESLAGAVDAVPELDRIVHLAAQAGVRYSLENPGAYVKANIIGQFNVLELARSLGPKLQHLVYASSSSVYGGNTKLPFAVGDPVDRPISLYAATKRADELMCHSYSDMFGVKATGLRFFSAYGPWGRPDMSAYIFTSKIIAGEPIPVFNYGEMSRDFTYVDDIVQGVVAALDRPPQVNEESTPHAIFNLGNHKVEPLMRFIGLIESALGMRAEIDYQPIQPGDVKATYADVETSRRCLGYEPRTSIDVGIPKFVAWYRKYHGI
ncbi:MAG: NAD-dependent epimerase/dehydratase family protein [Alphaproteobacteria bacterium]